MNINSDLKNLQLYEISFKSLVEKENITISKVSLSFKKFAF